MLAGDSCSRVSRAGHGRVPFADGTPSSRKKFTPVDHWLMTSEIDVQLFVQAALYEAAQAPADDGTPARGKARAREVAAYGPRLAVLNHIPFAVPFEVRVAVFHGWAWMDMRAQAGGDASATDVINPRARWHSMFRESGRTSTEVTVRRGHIAEDGFDRLGDADLKGRIKITFIDEWGNEEAGIDGGGVFKEFFTSLCKEVFDTDRGLWLANRVNELYPNPHGYATEGQYSHSKCSDISAN
jgi:ubiquitin-protein ligase E3 C